MVITSAVYAPNTPSLIGDLGVRHFETERALEDLGHKYSGTIDGIIVVSPHFVTGNSFGTITADKLKQIYDFSGFPREFYTIKYEPPGMPAVARQAMALASEAKVPLAEVRDWGLDHGAWSPLRRMFPEANIPVLPISLSPSLGPEMHKKLGDVLADGRLEGNFMLLVTGSIVHRLDLWVKGSERIPSMAMRYLAEVTGHLVSARWEQIWHIPRDLYRAAAPEGGEFPFRILSGALEDAFSGNVLASETEFGAASLTTIEFTRK